jgi:hypothetical protein
VLTTDQKGAIIGESAIAHAAIKLGIGVYKPLSDGERYDLIFEGHVAACVVARTARARSMRLPPTALSLNNQRARVN